MTYCIICGAELDDYICIKCKADTIKCLTNEVAEINREKLMKYARINKKAFTYKTKKLPKLFNSKSV